MNINTLSPTSKLTRHLTSVSQLSQHNAAQAGHIAYRSVRNSKYSAKRLRFSRRLRWRRRRQCLHESCTHTAWLDGGKTRQRNMVRRLLLCHGELVIRAFSQNKVLQRKLRLQNALSKVCVGVLISNPLYDLAGSISN